MENKKIIIVSLITIILVGILVCILVIDMPMIGISSVKTIISKHEEINSKEAQLLTEQNAYSSILSSVETAKSNYEKEKTKYDSISEETINIIKEFNTEETYSLEYMWIKLGNYAKKNNLSIVMIEPGNSNTTSTTPENTESVVDNSNTTPKKSTSSSNVLQIQVTGSYIDLSDFIFEVENDSELKFKLDNISMEYVSGTTIKTTFDVKNIIINK